MDPKIESYVGTVLLEFLAAGRSFTAYDVTVEARNRTYLNVRHSEVRQYVHSKMVTDAAYDHSTHNIKPGVECVIYHPIGSAPNAGTPLPPGSRTGLPCYGPNLAANVATPCAASTVASNVAPSKAPSRRVAIPAADLRAIGLTSWGEAYVQWKTGEVIVNAEVKRTSYAYMIDKDNNIRLSRKKLEASLGSFASIRVDRKKNRLVIYADQGQ